MIPALIAGAQTLGKAIIWGVAYEGISQYLFGSGDTIVKYLSSTTKTGDDYHSMQCQSAFSTLCEVLISIYKGGLADDIYRSSRWSQLADWYAGAGTPDSRMVANILFFMSKYPEKTANVLCIDTEYDDLQRLWLIISQLENVKGGKFGDMVMSTYFTGLSSIQGIDAQVRSALQHAFLALILYVKSVLMEALNGNKDTQTYGALGGALKSTTAIGTVEMSLAQILISASPMREKQSISMNGPVMKSTANAMMNLLNQIPSHDRYDFMVKALRSVATSVPFNSINDSLRLLL